MVHFRWLGMQHRQADQHHNQSSGDLEGCAADPEEPKKIIAKPGCQQQRNQEGESATAGIA